MVSRPPKGTSLRGTPSFDVFCVKIGARVSAVAFLKNPPPQKKIAESLCAEGRMRRTETPKPIWIKFCMVVDTPDAVKYTNFGDHRLRGFWVAGCQISPSPIDFHRRPYNTLALPCERVMGHFLREKCPTILGHRTSPIFAPIGRNHALQRLN